MERYENWKDLEPLENGVQVGTKCVCLSDSEGVFTSGEIITTIDDNYMPNCANSRGIVNGMRLRELALLPPEASKPAPEQKQERKIINGFCDNDGYIHVVCDDGTLWYASKSIELQWNKLPPIPQD